MGTWKTRGIAIAAVLELVAACQAPEKTLSLSVKPATINNRGQVLDLTAAALDGDRPGRGSIKFTSSAGALKSGETWPLDANGSAVTGFWCDFGQDPGCMNRVMLHAEWTSEGVTTTADKALTLSGGSGGSGGGAGSQALSSAPCMGSNNVMSVTGSAVPLGSLDFVATGQFGGVVETSSIAGGISVTAITGTPQTVTGTGLRIFTLMQATPTLGMEYSATNRSNEMTAAIGFSVAASNGSGGFIMSRDCVAGGGTGVFRFDVHNGLIGTSAERLGAFRFSCPDAGISVQGCFHIVP